MEKVNLHLGCGDKRIDGFINIDAMQTEAADLILNLADIRSQFQDNSVDYIYACHILEHLSRHTYFQVLNDLYQILKPEGMIRISVPDFEALAEYYIETRDLNEIRGTLFGGQRDQFDFHCWTWDFKSLSEDLRKIGYQNIQRYDPFQTPHAHIRDWSRDYVPRHDQDGNQLSDEVWFQGKLVSLNIEAKKPSQSTL